MKYKFQKFFPFLFLLLLTVLFFLPFLDGQHIPYAGDFTGSDLTELNLPSRYYASQSLQAGQVPLWTNLLANGFPLLAEGQAGVFYPSNLLLFLTLPFIWAVNLTFIFNFYLAGVFTYLYSKSIKITTYASLFAALIFSFSGFFIFRIKHLNLINAAIWLPLQFYLIEKYLVSSKKPLVLIALAVVFCIQFLAGHPQISYISVIASFSYFCLRTLSENNLNIRQALSKIIIPWIFIGTLSPSLAAIQLFPTLAYSSLSSRGLQMSYQQVVDFAFHLPSLLTLVSPYILGNPALATYPLNVREFGIFWENNIYFGLLPLFFSLTGAFFIAWRKKIGKSLLILAIISLLFVLGDKTPFFAIFWEAIPGLSTFRFPQRFLLVTLLCLSILAAMTFEWVFQKLQSFFEKKPLKSQLLFKHLLPVVLIALVAIDLFLVGFRYIGILDFKNFLKPPKAALFLQQDETIFRIANVKWPDAWHGTYLLANGWQNNLNLFVAERELLPLNLNVFWNISSAQDRGYFEGGLLKQEMQNLVSISDQILWQAASEDGLVYLPDNSSKLLGIQNVKYILSYDNLKSDSLILVNEIKKDFLPPVKIYQNLFYQPFAYGVFDVKISTSPQEDFDTILSGSFDPATSIILRKDILNLRNDQATSTVIVNSLKDGDIAISADFSADGYLYVSQSFSPGWVATVDGKTAEILQANHAFTAIPIQQGSHQIYLEYKPVAYVLGKLITALTLILILLLIYFFNIKHGYRYQRRA